MSCFEIRSHNHQSLIKVIAIAHKFNQGHCTTYYYKPILTLYHY